MPLKTVNGDHGGAHKGRGAALNLEGRFESLTREAVDDGWGDLSRESATRPQTIVTPLTARSIIQHNDSPDLPFRASINPYQGCEHGCIYCMAGDTQILLADGRTRQLADLRVGDVVYGTVRSGWYRRLAPARVLAHWRSVKPAYRINLEDGTRLVAGADHRFLTERGWRFVSERHRCDRRPRPHLAAGTKLVGTGAFAAALIEGPDYRRGYLCALMRSGGLALHSHRRGGANYVDQDRRCLALGDREVVERAEQFLRDWQIGTEAALLARQASGGAQLRAIRLHGGSSRSRVGALAVWPNQTTMEWAAGFLGGLFDTAGGYSEGSLIIRSADNEIIWWTCQSLRSLGLRYSVDYLRPDRGGPINLVQVSGGAPAHLRFFQSTDPAVVRKREMAAVSSAAQLTVASVEPLGKAMVLYDITTDTGDFIANGVVSHNCYARPSHAYLDLSPGLDFETRLFAKVNAAELLRDALTKPGYRCQSITLGANTDPYQPIERQWRITRQVLEVLAECNHPVAIITKSALVERDLDLLAPMAAKRLAEVYVSVTTLERELARRMEPRASAPQRRIEAIRALSNAGVPTGVMVAPIVPFLTDHAIESVLEAAAAAGAIRAGYTIMRLPWELKDLFKDWLEHHYPLKADHVMSRVRQLRGGKENDPNFGTRQTGTGLLAELLQKRFESACRRLGLNRERRGGDADTSLFRRPGQLGQLELFWRNAAREVRAHPCQR